MENNLEVLGQYRATVCAEIRCITIMFKNVNNRLVFAKVPNDWTINDWKMVFSDETKIYYFSSYERI